MKRCAAVASVAGLALAGCGSASREAAAPGPASPGAAQAATPARFSAPPVRHHRPRRRAARRHRRSGPLSAWVRSPRPLFSRPGGPRLGTVPAHTPFGSATVLGVVRQRGPWLAVTYDRLPNGRTGWLRTRDVKLLRPDYSVHASISRRIVVVRHRGRIVQRFPVAIGQSATPTPTGRFSVTDKLLGRVNATYGCCVLAISGHQPRLPTSWPGGDRLAIHGTTDPASVGSAATLGCLRARGSDVRRLVRTVPLGAPVVITR